MVFKRKRLSIYNKTASTPCVSSVCPDMTWNMGEHWSQHHSTTVTFHLCWPAQLIFSHSGLGLDTNHTRQDHLQLATTVHTGSQATYNSGAFRSPYWQLIHQKGGDFNMWVWVTSTNSIIRNTHTHTPLLHWLPVLSPSVLASCLGQLQLSSHRAMHGVACHVKSGSHVPPSHPTHAIVQEARPYAL